MRFGYLSSVQTANSRSCLRSVQLDGVCVSLAMSGPVDASGSFDVLALPGLGAR